MNKSIKKYILIITTVILSFTLVACNKTPSAEEAINKSAEFSKNIKNTDFVSTTTSEIIIGEKNEKVENKVTGSIILDPLAIHATTEVKALDKTQKLELYIKDGVAYGLSTGQDTWMKTSNDNITSQFENLKKVANDNIILDFYKKISKDFKIEKENDNYVLTYTGNGDQFRELMVALANSSSGNQVSSDVFDDVEFKNVTIKYVLNKNYEPVSNEIIMDLATKNASTPTTLKISHTTSYSNINKVSNFDLPEEAKNAQEVARNSD